MVYRFSARRLFVFAAFVTCLIIVFEIWPLLSLDDLRTHVPEPSALAQISLKQLLLKNKLDTVTSNDFSGNYIFTDQEEDNSQTEEIQTTTVQTPKSTLMPQPVPIVKIEPNETQLELQTKSAQAPQITEIESPPTKKLWFFKNGTIRPERQGSAGTKDLKIWPHEDRNNDRIVNQLMYIPNSYDAGNVKTILVANALGSWGVAMGSSVFEGCPVSSCKLTSNEEEIREADAVLFRDGVTTSYKREPNSSQIWIIYELECPNYSSLDSFIPNEDEINWTATYRVDSDLVTPYEKWVYYNESQKTNPRNRGINYASGKTHKVAWFVSNCNARNNRLQYARELQKFISVDIYGNCGSLKCPPSSKDHCFDLLNTKYKFYLSFENSNCKDYITEKLFVNGLSHNILPIVMGAPKADYVRSAPLNSFIHVDDFKSPKKLAEYLNLLDSNDTLYNSYFQWKGTGEFINTYFWCRLCTMVHDGGLSVIGAYADVGRWWSHDVCYAKKFGDIEDSDV